MIGKKFKDWTVLRQVKSNRRGRRFECKCKCGKLQLLNAYQLSYEDRNKMCMICYHKSRSNTAYENLIGKQKGKWTVLKRLESKKNCNFFIM